MGTKTKYAIAILRNVYQPDIQGLGAVGYVGADNGTGNPDLYDTVADAQSAIDELEAEVYCTMHGEAGAPEYVIVDQAQAEYVPELGDYDWDDSDCDCGECNECYELMIDQDQKRIKKAEIKE